MSITPGFTVEEIRQHVHLYRVCTVIGVSPDQEEHC